MPEDSDSSGEMALAADTSRKSTTENIKFTQQSHSIFESAGEGAESAGRSSLDATLSELPDQPPSQKSQRKGRPRERLGRKKCRNEGCPCERNSSRRSDGHGPSCPDPQTRSTILTWSGATCANRISR